MPSSEKIAKNRENKDRQVMEKREFDLFELIRILLKNRVFIIVFVAIVCVAAVI